MSPSYLDVLRVLSLIENFESLWYPVLKKYCLIQGKKYTYSTYSDMKFCKIHGSVVLRWKLF
uniref:Uncharacterized protein n=1 Tax=Arundo donax TaxID=35708 RepID=A0A0A9FGR5_ARUDO